MTSPRRRASKPVESVELRISFRAGRLASMRIKEAIPTAKVRAGGCEVRLSGEEPGEVAQRARALLDVLRSATGGEEVISQAPGKKDFKRLEGAASRS